MNIIHVTGYFPPHIGGMEYRTKELAENQAKNGNHVQVFTSDKGCAVGKLPSTKNLKIHYLKSWEFAHTPLMPSLLFNLLRIPKEDTIVHLHISQAFLAELTYIVCKLRGIPYVTHIHLDVSASGAFGVLLPLYKKFFLSRVIREADGICVLTEDYKVLMSDMYKLPKNRMTIIPNGTYFHGGANRTGEIHTPTRLLFVGRLSVQKNLPLLINAVYECVNKYKLSVHLTVAGDGEKRQECEELVKQLKLEDYVTFLGGIPLKEMPKIYSSSDIFILTSIQESFGSVLVEAMGSGTPVISTNILAVKNIIKNGYNGLLVEQDASDLAKAIVRLINDEKLRKSLVSNGLKEVKKYTWESITEQYQTLYQSILRKRAK